MMIQPRLRSDHVLGYAVHPAFLEIRNLLNVLLGDVSMLEAGAIDVAHAAETELAATRRRLERTGLGLTRHLLALEATLTASGGPACIDDAIDAADALARHVTRDVGGVRWQRDETPALVADTRAAAVIGIAAGLRLLAEGLTPGATRGIDAEVRLRATSAEIVLVAPEATAAIYRAAGAELRSCTPSGRGLSVESSARGLTLVWRRSSVRVAI